jgi:uncharacterized protein with PIN domain
VFLDASAIVAMIIGEPDAEELAVKLKRTVRPAYCALGHFEAVLAVARAKDANGGRHRFDRYVV